MIDINTLTKYTKKELIELINSAQTCLNNKFAAEYQARVKYNRQFVGKCYRREVESTWFKTKTVYYYKCISEYGKNELCASFLRFPEEPYLHISHNATKKYSTYIADLFTFSLDDIMVSGTTEILNFLDNTMKEISEEEWNLAFDKHCKLLKELRDSDYEINKNT